MTNTPKKATGSFDDSINRAEALLKVLDQLANETACGDTPDPKERSLWFGIAELTKDIQRCLDTVRGEHYATSHELYCIKHPLPAEVAR